MARDIVLQINDFLSAKTCSYQISDIGNDMTIREILEIIKKKQNYSQDADSLILYFARIECKHDNTLSTYNKSNRKNIKLELYLSNIITVKIQTLQSCGSGTTRCIPFWSICFTQTIKIKIKDTAEVRLLKQQIYDMTSESSQILPEHMVLLFKKAPLNNFLTLKESEIVDGSKIKMFVPLCYIHKSKKDEEEAKKKKQNDKDNKDNENENDNGNENDNDNDNKKDNDSLKSSKSNKSSNNGKNNKTEEDDLKTNKTKTIKA